MEWGFFGSVGCIPIFGIAINVGIMSFGIMVQKGDSESYIRGMVISKKMEMKDIFGIN